MAKSSEDKRPKVFGIGFQRTGTLSLAKGCGILGWKALHGDYNRFPGGLDLSDPVYGEYDMFCDTPFYLLVEKLDRRFSGSKFILTERRAESWVASVSKLFEYNRNFERYPAARLYHIVAYGTAVFDAGAMLSAFEAHNRRVRAYFADRPDDLLLMDVTAGDGWEELCPFLEVETPDEAFPHLNERSRMG